MYEEKQLFPLWLEGRDAASYMESKAVSFGFMSVHPPFVFGDFSLRRVALPPRGLWSQVQVGYGNQNSTESIGKLKNGNGLLK